MDILTPTIKEAIRSASLQAYEKRIEACGLIVNGKAIACKNTAADHGENPMNTFVIEAKEFKRRSIQAVWHSHINQKISFSPADARSCRASGYKFVLHEVLGDRWAWCDPSYDGNIMAEHFVYGVEDCYKVICRWYWQNRQIRLADYDRAELFDEHNQFIFRTKNWDMFRENFAKEGFKELSPRWDLEVGDVLLMQIAGAPNPNHLGVVIDASEKVFLHQTHGAGVRKEFWLNDYIDETVAILRKES